MNTNSNTNCSIDLDDISMELLFNILIEKLFREVISDRWGKKWDTANQKLKLISDIHALSIEYFKINKKVGDPYKPLIQK